MAKMTKSELASLVDAQINDAKNHNETERASLRDKALEYRDGVMKDLPAEKGRSSVVSRVVSDTIGWVRPGMMRIFLSSDRIADFQPRRPDQVKYYKDVTEYVNAKFLEECNGYKVLSDGIDDGLTLANGILKHYWDTTPEEKVENFSGLSDDAFTAIVGDENVKVLEYSARTETSAAGIDPGMGAEEIGAQPSPGGDTGYEGGQSPAGGIAAGNGPAMADIPMDAGGISPPPQTHDVKIKRTTKSGHLCVKSIPNENFLIVRDATVLDETISGCGDWDTPTRSDLIKRGFKKADVDLLPQWMGDEGGDGAAKDARDPLRQQRDTSENDKSMERVKVYEWYPLVDYDGDGIAERRYIVIGDRTTTGSKGERKILSNEEWGDDLPYTDLVPDPVAHRWRGRSVYDELAELQRVETAVSRGMLDNIYAVNNPQRAGNFGMIDNPDEIINPTFGGFVRTKGNPNEIISDLVVPFIGEQCLTVLEHMEHVREGRGYPRSIGGLDPEVLQNQTATAVAEQKASATSKIELYARNLAEIGMRRLFKCIYRLLCKHQNTPEFVRMKGELVEMNPKIWDADMDVSINVGLGAGSRDRDMMALQQVLMKQEQILLQAGPSNPWVTAEQYGRGLAKLVEVSGLRMPELYFNEVTPEATQQWQEAMANQPNPEMEKLQAEMQMKSQELQQKAQIEQVQAQADIATQERKTASEERLAEKKFALERELKIMDHQLKLEEHKQNMAFREREHAVNIEAMREQTGMELQGKAADQNLKHRDMEVSHAYKAEEHKMKHADMEKSHEYKEKEHKLKHEALKAKAKPETPTEPAKPRKLRVIRDKEGRISGAEEH